MAPSNNRFSVDDCIVDKVNGCTRHIIPPLQNYWKPSLTTVRTPTMDPPREGGLEETYPRRRVNLTDADFALEMNALTAQERRSLEEDIHGASDSIEETEDFVCSKLSQMREELKRIPPNLRGAWDRAVFLRPSLNTDDPLHLLYLRALRFDPARAGKRMVAFFENKLKHFGDALLVQRITWRDLTDQERDMIRDGLYRIVERHESTGRGVAYVCARRWNGGTSEDVLRLMRIFMYVQSAIQDYPDMQRKGVVTIIDLRESLSSSSVDELLQFLSSLASVSDTSPFHTASNHVLYDNEVSEAFLQSFRSLLSSDHRRRTRYHGGILSDEIESSLRTFGLDLGRLLGTNVASTGVTTRGEIEEYIQEREGFEERWRRSESLHREPTAHEALFPNPFDIILGRNKRIAAVWPGNRVFNTLVEQNTPRYVEALAYFEKTVITLEIIHTLQKDHGARFLWRKGPVWESLDGKWLHQKVGQALRLSAARFAPQQIDREGSIASIHHAIEPIAMSRRRDDDLISVVLPSREPQESQETTSKKMSPRRKNDG